MFPVNSVTERTVAAGARVLTPIEDTFWGIGWRIADPQGHVWNEASRESSS
jgi:uncharacterized glyoxalase superfamily protein PhnB